MKRSSKGNGKTTPKGVSVFWAESKGRFIMSYATPTGWKPKALPKFITSQRDADKWALDFIAAEGGKPTEIVERRAAEGILIAEVAEKWIPLRAKNPKVSPATLSNNKSHLKMHILPKFGMTALAAMDTSTARSWLREIRETMSPQHCRNVYYTAATMYGDAMVEPWGVKRESNPFSHPAVVRELPELEEAEPMVLALANVQTLCEASAVDLERRAKYMLAFTSGMRSGEIAGLRLSDLERDAEVPHYCIERSVATVGPEGWASPKKTKNKGSKRILPFHLAGLAAVNEWIKTGWHSLVGRKPEPNDYLFPGVSGDGARPRDAEQIREDLVRAGLPDSIKGKAIEFKASRSSFATWLQDAGVSDDMRKRLLGHALKDVTSKHYTSKDIAQLAEAIGRLPLVWIAGIMPPVIPVGIEIEAKSSKALSRFGGLNPGPTVYENNEQSITIVPEVNVKALVHARRRRRATVRRDSNGLKDCASPMPPDEPKTSPVTHARGAFAALASIDWASRMESED